MAKLFNKYAPGMTCSIEVEVDEVLITDEGITYRVFIDKNGRESGVFVNGISECQLSLVENKEKK